MKKRFQQIAGGILLVNLAVLVYFKSGEDTALIVTHAQGTRVGFYPDDAVNNGQYDAVGAVSGDLNNINNNNNNNNNNRASVEYDGVLAAPNITFESIIAKPFTLPGRPGYDLRHQQRSGQFVAAQPLQATGSFGDSGVHNSCGGLRAPVTPHSPSWQAVVLNNTYVYSAFYDDRASPQNPVVKIIGISQQETRRGLFHCQVWFHSRADDGRGAGQPLLKVVPADVDIVPETHERRYIITLKSPVFLHVFVYFSSLNKGAHTVTPISVCMVHPNGTTM
jgi:hypothetical protein